MRINYKRKKKTALPVRYTTQLFTTSNFIGPGYHAALLFLGLGFIVVLSVLLFSQQIREDLVRAAYFPKGRLTSNTPHCIRACS